MTESIATAAAVTLAEKVRSGELSPVDIVDAYLARIAERDGTVGAYITVLEEQARSAAVEQTRQLAEGSAPGPLAGVPVGVKDIVDVEGVPTTQGTSLFADNTAESDDPVVTRLRDGGSIVLGKTNTPAFARSAVTESDIAGYCSTPFGEDYNAGGSSGGSAAAVAAGMAAIGYGTDGGGSIRIPASLCGVVGHKPTFGLIPWVDRPDVFAHARGNHAGPITRTVPDAAFVLDAIAGPDHGDPFSHPKMDRSYLAATEEDPQGLDIAYSPDLGVFPVADAVERVLEDAVSALADATSSTVHRPEIDFGLTLEELVEPKYHNWGPVHTAVLTERVAEEYGIDLTEHPEVVGESFVESAAKGYEIDAVSYKRVNDVHTQIYHVLQDVFAEYDLLVTPTLSVSRVENGTIGPETIDGKSVDPSTDWFLTFPFNFGGPPALSVPAGSVDGFPVGVQIAGQRFTDDTVLAAGAALERARPWHHLYEEL
ncbi:MAG: amidase [Natronomonas sp.]|uniref:amidase n=1 Tax=Natronomonas sp. TaxID=2184060 RepID=UPI0028700592|nr:amidase [Natronomonas sp.]MDR9431998.1 amidase [Natronomonas sp.]